MIYQTIFDSTSGSISILQGPLILFKLNNADSAIEVESYLKLCSHTIQQVNRDSSRLYTILDTAEIHSFQPETIGVLGNFLVEKLTMGIRINAWVTPRNLPARQSIEMMLTIIDRTYLEIAFQSQHEAIEAVRKSMRRKFFPTIL